VWSLGMRTPPWAAYAHKHGWLTLGELWLVPLEPDPKPVRDLLYRNAPLLHLIAKDTSFDVEARAGT
jgi:hypothetical protein